MKRKLLIMLVIFTLLFSNFAFAANYSKSDSDKDLKDVAKIADSEDTYIGTQYTAQSKSINNYASNVRYKIAGLDTKAPTKSSILEERLQQGTLEITGNLDGFKTFMKQEGTSGIYKVWLEIDKTKVNSSYIIYKNAISYNNKNYDVKIKVTSNYVSEDNIKFRFLIGAVQITSGKFNAGSSNLNLKAKEYSIRPEIVVSGMKNLETEKAELSVDYTIGSYNSTTDTFTAEQPISGLFTLGEVDFGQGIVMNNWKINEENANVFIKQKLADINFMKYQANDSSTYFYTTNKENMNSNVEDIYLLMENVINIPMTLTFDGNNAGSHFEFNSNLIKKQDQEQVKVTFDPQGGSPTPDSQQVEKGKVATNPTKQPTKDGYIFTGWYTEKECKNKYDFSTAVEKDITLYAGWEAIPYTVTFDPQGGSPTPDSQQVEKGKVATEPTNPTKNGYTFTGWYTEKECKNKYNFSTAVEDNKTLYAGWEAIQYNITYVLNGGNNDSRNPSTYTKEDTVTFKSPTKENSTFLGWYENADFSGNPIGSISNRTGNITLYAKWKTNEAENAKYKTEYYTEENGKYILRDTSEGEGKVGTSVTAVRKTFDGYEENTTYNERKATGTVKADGSLVLKLYYDKKQYKVTFDAQGGEEAKKGDLDDQTVKYNDKATKPTNPTKDGYEFEYWYYKKDGKEVQYNFDDPVTDNVELIAKWKTKSSGTSTSGKTDPSTNTNSSTNTVTSGKVDPTTASKSVLPNTGSFGMILIISVIVAGTIFFGIRYFKLKNDMK